MSITNYILAGYPLLWIDTYEEFQALATYCGDMKKSKKGKTYSLFTWDCADGIKQITLKDGVLASGKPITMKAKNEDGEEVEMPTDGPLTALEWLENEAGDNTVLFLKDYHHALDKDHFQHAPRVYRKIRNIIQQFKACGKHLVVMAPTMKIPDDLMADTTLLHFQLPDRDKLRQILKSICESCGVAYPQDDEPVIDAAMGLSTIDAENSFAKSIVDKGGVIDPKVILEAKKDIVRKNTEGLTICDFEESLDDIGGLENMKNDLIEANSLFTEEARDFGAEIPKGMLLVGISGTGKSLTAKAVATAWNRPLFRLDMGKMFSKWQGESEERMTRVLQTVEVVAPCVLWIDELEKSFAGTSGGDEATNGTKERMLQDFLTWLNDRTKDVFVVATANNVKALPQELIRPGRIDTMYWVEAPDAVQREEILKIHLKKKGRKEDTFTAAEYKKLVEASDGMVGAGIQTWVKHAINKALLHGHDEVTVDDFMETINKVQRVRDTAKVKEARSYALNTLNASPASINHDKNIEEAATTSGGRKIQTGGDDAPKTGKKQKKA